jgi:hypothetical protein
MRLATISIKGLETAAIVQNGQAFVIAAINEALGMNWQTDLLSILRYDQISLLNTWYRDGGMTRIDSLSEAAIPLPVAGLIKAI